MNTSSPRTFSSIFTNVSPSGNGLMVHLPSSMPMDLQMAWAKGSIGGAAENFHESKIFLVKTAFVASDRSDIHVGARRRKTPPLPADEIVG